MGRDEEPDEESLLERIQREATTKAASMAARGLLDRVKAAIESEGNDLADYAEAELERITTEREERQARLEAAGAKAREERLSRKERAKAELARLKAARGLPASTDEAEPDTEP